MDRAALAGKDRQMNTVSLMFTVEVMVPEDLDPSDLEQEIVTELENELQGQNLDIRGDGDRDDLELEVGAIGSIDDGSVIDDGYAWRRGAAGRAAAERLIQAQRNIANACLENRGLLERSRHQIDRDRHHGDDVGEDLECFDEILAALDGWHDQSIDELKAAYAGDGNEKPEDTPSLEDRGHELGSYST